MMHKETIAYRIPNVETSYDKDYIEFIVKHLSQELSDKLITILDKENEVVVRQSKVEMRRYNPTDSVEYRRQIEWCQLVRCKDCMYNPSINVCDICQFVDSDGYIIRLPDDDFFCKSGERKEEND